MFLKNATHVMFSYKTNIDDVVEFIRSYFPKFIFERCGDPRRLREEVVRLWGGMHGYRYGGGDWAVFDLTRQKWNIIHPSVPNSYIVPAKG